MTITLNAVWVVRWEEGNWPRRSKLEVFADELSARRKAAEVHQRGHDNFAVDCVEVQRPVVDTEAK